MIPWAHPDLLYYHDYCFKEIYFWHKLNFCFVDVDKEIVITVMKIFQDKDLGTQDSLSGTGHSHFSRNFIKFAIRPRKRCCVSGSPTVRTFLAPTGNFFLLGSGYSAGPNQIVPRGYSTGPGQIVPRLFSWVRLNSYNALIGYLTRPKCFMLKYLRNFYLFSFI